MNYFCLNQSIYLFSLNAVLGFVLVGSSLSVFKQVNLSITPQLPQTPNVNTRENHCEHQPNKRREKTELFGVWDPILRWALHLEMWALWPSCYGTNLIAGRQAHQPKQIDICV